jgi:hypothetical protein
LTDKCYRKKKRYSSHRHIPHGLSACEILNRGKTAETTKAPQDLHPSSCDRVLMPILVFDAQHPEQMPVAAWPPTQTVRRRTNWYSAHSSWFRSPGCWGVQWRTSSATERVMSHKARYRLVSHPSRPAGNVMVCSLSSAARPLDDAPGRKAHDINHIVDCRMVLEH